MGDDFSGRDGGVRPADDDGDADRLGLQDLLGGIPLGAAAGEADDVRLIIRERLAVGGRDFTVVKEGDVENTGVMSVPGECSRQGTGPTWSERDRAMFGYMNRAFTPSPSKKSTASCISSLIAIKTFPDLRVLPSAR